MAASSGAAEHSYSNPSASCQAQSEGAAVWGSFHGIRLGSVEGVPEFVEPFMNGSPGLTDIHEEIFSYRPDTVEAGLSGDISEFVFVSGKRDPWGPGEILPSGREKVQEYQALGG